MKYPISFSFSFATPTTARHAGLPTLARFQKVLRSRRVQGCLLLPFLFLLVIDWIMMTVTTSRSNGIHWTLLTQLDDLDFADDLALLSHNHKQMQDKTTHLAISTAWATRST
jgi:hypothetical protein